MPDHLIAPVLILLAALAILFVLWVARRMAILEAQWFQGILHASDAELAARPIPDLDRDYRRMGDMVRQIRIEGQPRPSRITAGLAANQHARLASALESAALAFHAGGVEG